MKIKLKNETIIEVLDNTTTTDIIINFDDITSLDEFRKDLTDDNLSIFNYLDDSDNVIATYVNYTLINTSYVVEDEKYQATFSLRQYTDTEVRLNALEKEQVVQNEAINALTNNNESE